MALGKTARSSAVRLVMGLALGLAIHVAPVSALPVTLGFDNLGSLGCDANNPASSGVPNAYGGLNWASASGGFPVDVVGLECDANYQGPSYNNTYGAPSPDFAAFNTQGYGEILITPVSGTFDFFGAQFSSFVFDNGVNGYDPFSAYSVLIAGYLPGDLVTPAFSFAIDLYSDNTVTINPASYVSFASGGWLGLGALAFFAGDNTIGNSPTFGGDGRTFLVDDVNVNLNPAPIPEPGTALLLLAGLVAMARYPKRRRA